jgi:superfamily II DNA/RNA helicase
MSAMTNTPGCQSGTGAGKTLGYMVPLLRYVVQEHRAGVSDFTRALHMSVMTKTSGCRFSPRDTDQDGAE